MRHPFTTTCLLSLLAMPVVAVDATLYGVVHKSMMLYGDGQDSQVTIADHNFDPTRFGLKTEHALDNGLTLGSVLEIAVPSNSSSALTQNTTANQARTPANSLGTPDERIARVGVSGPWGTLLVGQQDVATDDAFTHDLAAAGTYVNSNYAAMGGALVFQSYAGGIYTPQTLGGADLTPTAMVLGNNGDVDKAPAVRYNSPDFKGFNSSISVAQGGNIATTVRYATTAGAFQLDSALGYKFMNNRATSTDVANGQMAGSLSLLHTTGVGATVGYIRQTVGAETYDSANPNGAYAKLGYAWNNLGVAADWSRYTNPIPDANHNSLTSYGVGAEWTVSDGVMLGTSARTYNANVGGVAGLKDINVLMTGMRVVF